jgi:hypothetical protein
VHDGVHCASPKCSPTAEAAKNTCLSHQSKNDLVDPAPAASRASGPPTVAGSSVLVLLELTLGSNSLRSSPFILCSGMNEQRLTGQGYEPLEPRRKDRSILCPPCACNHY